MVDVTVRVQLTNGFTVPSPLTNGFCATADFLIGTDVVYVGWSYGISVHTRGERVHTRGERVRPCAHGD